MIPTGTKVYHHYFGWGEVVEIRENDSYPIIVDFSKYKGFSFTLDGRHTEKETPTLSLTYYDFVNGGFTPLSEYNKPKVGDWGYFWDKEDDDGCYYGKLYKPLDKHFKSKTLIWQNFSKEIPEHIKKLQDEK